MVLPEKRFSLSRREFEHFSNKGLEFYKQNKIRVEKLTLSITKGRSDILLLFDNFIERISLGRPYAPSYIMVVVDGQHLHAFWRKPFFMTIQQLGSEWNKVTKDESNCKNKTASSKQNTVISGQDELIKYLLNQEEHHEEVDKLTHKAQFYQSLNWGKKFTRPKKSDKLYRTYEVEAPASIQEIKNFNLWSMRTNGTEDLKIACSKYMH